MKKEDLFIENTKRLFDVEKIKKINTLIKDNVIIIPLIYIIGTIILLVRNKILEFPFYPINIIQFALIIVYLIISLGCYCIVEYFLKQFISQLKKGNSIISKFKITFWYVLLLQLILILISLVFSLIITIDENLIEIIIGYYIFIPILLLLLKKNSKSAILNYIITIIFYMTIITYIPISMGGFKGQKVYFYNDDLNAKKEYIFYGISNSMYQFSNENNIYLIPVDKGYIEYKK